MSGHSEERQEDAPMETSLHGAHLRMAIPGHIELARGRAQVGIQALLKSLIKDDLKQ